MKVWSLGRSRFALLTFCACFVLGSRPTQAQPANDSFANRETITGLPFTDVESSIRLATVEPTDPSIFCRQAGIGTGGNTVWYSYTTGPVDEYVDFTTVNSDYDTIVAFYTGGPGAFALVGGGCNDNAISTRARVAGLRLRSNTTYSIVVARPTQSVSAVTLRIWVDVSPVYHVTKTADTADGVCDADCSLREAIGASNTNPGAVVVPAGAYLLTQAGVEDNNASGDLDLRVGMSIYGAGVASTVIDAGGLDRAVDIDPDTTGLVSAYLNGLTLTNGQSTGDGGGLRSPDFRDFLMLEDVAIMNSTCGASGGGLALGAIGLLRRVTVSGNQASMSGGGAHFEVNQTVEMHDSTISNNISLSPSTKGGGGIYSRMNLRLDQVTISGNMANFAGGGVFVDSSGVLVMRNATIIGNVADADNNDTSSGGGIHLNGSSYNIANSVIANNHAYGGVPSDLNDCRHTSGTLVSSYNHVRIFDNCLFEGPGDTNIQDPLVAPLASNGGPTQTHAILVGSLLRNTGDPAGCRDHNGVPLLYDQRGPGFLRTIGGNCDKGAYEFGAGGGPNAPSNLIAVAIGDTSASLQWQDNSNDEATFQIERASAAGGPWVSVGAVAANTTTFIDNSLAPLTDYYFRVFARNAGGDSPPTMALLVHTTPVELQSFTVE